MFKNILRNFARRSSRRMAGRMKPFKKTEKLEKKVEVEDFFDEDDEDIYIIEPTITQSVQNPVLSTLEKNGLEEVFSYFNASGPESISI